MIVSLLAPNNCNIFFPKSNMITVNMTDNTINIHVQLPITFSAPSICPMNILSTRLYKILIKKILELDKGIYKKHSEKNKIIPSAYVLIIKSPQFIN